MQRNEEIGGADDDQCQTAHLLEAGERMLPDHAQTPLPHELCGFYISRFLDGRYCFGRPKNRVIFWEIVELIDLLDFGINLDDLKSIAPGRAYRVKPTSVVLQSWD